MFLLLTKCIVSCLLVSFSKVLVVTKIDMENDRSREIVAENHILAVSLLR